MDPVGVVDDLDHLGITHPVASVETKRDRALLGYCCVYRSLVISDGGGGLRAVLRLSGVGVGLVNGEVAAAVAEACRTLRGGRRGARGATG